MLRQHGGGERNRAHAQQKEKVQKQKPVIRSLDVREQAVVVDPHNPDKCEAEDESKIRRPLTEKLQRKIAAPGSGDLDFQDQ